MHATRVQPRSSPDSYELTDLDTGAAAVEGSELVGSSREAVGGHKLSDPGRMVGTNAGGEVQPHKADDGCRHVAIQAAGASKAGC